jgi:hypothetical protein
MSSSDNNLQDKLDNLIRLVSTRSEGITNDDALEQAISSLLSNASIPATSTSSNTKNNASNPDQKKIVEDEDDYDNIDATDTNIVTGSSPTMMDQKLQAATDDGASKPAWTGEQATIESLNQQEANMQLQKDKMHFTISKAWKNLEDIPLGRTGAKIMITFGDGPEPTPTACATALLATRQCLQTAIKDSRALRRQTKIEYDKARAAVNLHKAKKKDRSILGLDDAEGGGATGVDMNLYFKAITGHDKLSRENPTGFDETQLEKLFPEEMYAYKRWNKMHQEYTASKDDKMAETAGNDDDKNESKNAEDEVGGHLRNRLAQFDLRTDRMKNQWYMAFSEVRQGSFLARGGLSSEDRAWEKERKKARGKRKSSTWEALPSSHIQFVHWLGFDQRSPLPPPDAATTEALAFLGYDFCGKIIEKAIFIKCLGRREEMRRKGANEDDFVLELNSDEQLTKEDIEMALNDSTVVPKPLYNSANSTQAADAAQIYFGPGFEERIEMEMEQYVLSH